MDDRGWVAEVGAGIKVVLDLHESGFKGGNTEESYSQLGDDGHTKALLLQSYGGMSGLILQEEHLLIAG